MLCILYLCFFHCTPNLYECSNIAFNVNISFLNAKDYIIFMTCEENCNIDLEFCISMSQDNYLSLVMKTTHRDHIKTVCVKNRYLFKFFKSGKKLLISLKKVCCFYKHICPTVRTVPVLCQLTNPIIKRNTRQLECRNVQ